MDIPLSYLEHIDFRQWENARWKKKLQKWTIEGAVFAPGKQNLPKINYISKLFEMHERTS